MSARDDYEWRLTIKGGPGSGNWGHAGRPGQVGGSMPRNIAMSRATGRDWQERQQQAAGEGRATSQADAVFESAARGDNVKSDNRLGGGINDSRLVQYKGDGKGVWKEHSSFNNATAEIAVDRLDDALELGIVPRTVRSKLGEKDGSSQRFIEGAQTAVTVRNKDYRKYDNLMDANRERIEGLVLIDYLTGYPDRHEANYIFDKQGKVWSIDHGLCNYWNERAGWLMARDYLGATMREGTGIHKISAPLLKKIRGLTKKDYDRITRGTTNINGIDEAWKKVKDIQRTGELRW